MITKNASAVLKKIAAACPTCGKEGYGNPTNNPVNQNQPSNPVQQPTQNSGRPQWFEDWLKTQKPAQPNYDHDSPLGGSMPPSSRLPDRFRINPLPTSGKDTQYDYLSGEREWLRKNWRKAIVNPYSWGRSTRPIHDLQY